MAKTLASHLIAAQSEWSSLYRSVVLAGAFVSLSFYPEEGWLIAVLLCSALFYFLMGRERKRVRISFVTTAVSGAVLFTHGGVLAALPLGLAFVAVFWVLHDSTQPRHDAAQEREGKSRFFQPLRYPLILFLGASALLTLAESVFLGVWAAVATLFLVALAGEMREENNDAVERLLDTLLFVFLGLSGLFFAHMLPFSPVLGGALTALILSVMRDISRFRGERDGRAVTPFLLREMSVFAFGLLVLLALAFM